MSDTVNPYQSPGTAVIPEKPVVAPGSLTETMLFYLKGASPWLKFMGVMGFIGSGLMALWGIIMIALMPLMTHAWSEVPEFDTLINYMGAAFNGLFALFFIVAAVVMFFPALFTYRFGDKIHSYIRTGADQDLELAFRNNKYHWKFLGIVTIIELAFIPLVIVGGIITAVVLAFSL
ncbi:MAG: hypothetical protein FWF26_00655 [Treponema sp.]|nr:hypothetical protein [Treponema sp.]